MRSISFGRALAVLALICALLLSCLLGGCTQSSAPYELEDIYDEAVTLIERAYAVNDVVLGYGLPTWAIGSEYANRVRIYADDDFANYEYVTEYPPFGSIGELKDALEAVYSQDYLESLYITLFEGSVGGTNVIHAQFSESDGKLLQSVAVKPVLKGQRIYDYATMRIVSPSNQTYVTIELESHLEHSTDSLTVRLGLSLENGEWRLDTPTY